MKEKMLKIIYPTEDGDVIEVISEQTAINRMKRVHPNRYPNDAEALDDFIVINWAWYENEI